MYPLSRLARVSALAAGFAAVFGAASATSTISAASRGEALAQRFLGPEVSVLRTPRGASCIASAPIAVRDSSYSEPDGAAVPFSDIVRSPAASVQVVAPLNGGARSLRVQLKFSVAPGRPIMLEGPGFAFNVADAVEPTTDSVRLTRPARVAAVFDALAAGEDVRLTAQSRDTARTVIDRLPALDRGALETCLANPSPARAVTPPADRAVTLEATAAPTARSRVEPVEAADCGMAETGGPIHLGRVLRTTGFFAQTRDVYVVFDGAGRATHAYVPGVFKAIGSGGGLYAGDVSIAADANAPDAPNRVTGCIGAAPARFCAWPAAPGVVAFGPCEGALLAGDLLSAEMLDQGELLGDFTEIPFDAAAVGPEPVLADFGLSSGGSTQQGEGFNLGSAIPGGGGVATGGGGRGGSVAGGASGSRSSQSALAEESVAIIPAPAAIWSLAGALGLLAALRRWTRRAARSF